MRRTDKAIKQISGYGLWGYVMTAKKWSRINSKRGIFKGDTRLYFPKFGIIWYKMASFKNLKEFFEWMESALNELIPKKIPLKKQNGEAFRFEGIVWSQKRIPEEVLGRFIAFYFFLKFREEANGLDKEFSLVAICDYIGGKHHATVIYGTKKIETLTSAYPKFKAVIETVEEKLKERFTKLKLRWKQ